MGAQWNPNGHRRRGVMAQLIEEEHLIAFAPTQKGLARAGGNRPDLQERIEIGGRIGMEHDHRRLGTRLGRRKRHQEIQVRDAGLIAIGSVMSNRLSNGGLAGRREETRVQRMRGALGAQDGSALDIQHQDRLEGVIAGELLQMRDQMGVHRVAVLGTAARLPPGHGDRAAQKPGIPLPFGEPLRDLAGLELGDGLEPRRHIGPLLLEIQRDANRRQQGDRRRQQREGKRLRTPSGLARAGFWRAREGPEPAQYQQIEQRGRDDGEDEALEGADRRQHGRAVDQPCRRRVVEEDPEPDEQGIDKQQCQNEEAPALPILAIRIGAHSVSLSP